MMHVIIGEGLHDEDYVGSHTVGFDELAEHVVPVHAGVGGGRDRASPADDIRTLAREYATTEPSMIRVGVALERSTGGGNAARAVFSLPALVGAWRKVGGGVLQMPIWAFPVRWDELHGPHPQRRHRPHHQPVAPRRGARRRVRRPAGQGAVRLQLQPGGRHLGAARACSSGLARDDLFTVVSEHFVTDTARYRRHRPARRRWRWSRTT